MCKHAASANHGEVSQASGSIRYFLGKGNLLLADTYPVVLTLCLDNTMSLTDSLAYTVFP